MSWSLRWLCTKLIFLVIILFISPVVVHSMELGSHGLSFNNDNKIFRGRLDIIEIILVMW
jgi:hypothetical protein